VAAGFPKKSCLSKPGEPPSILSKSNWALVWWIWSSYDLAAHSYRNFKSKNLTRITELLSVLSIPQSDKHVPQTVPDFGIGTLGA
jgi:hypothetical protein